jgi:hypothetical protein
MKAPTVMDLSLEIEFCHRLMKLESMELEQNWPLVSEIFERLCESHMDTIYELVSIEEMSFFTRWLRHLAEKTSFAGRKKEPGYVEGMFSYLPK